MYDIRIFLEDNGQFGAVATLGKEKIYGVGNSRSELISSLKDGISLSNSSINSIEASKFENFLQAR